MHDEASIFIVTLDFSLVLCYFPSFHVILVQVQGLEDDLVRERDSLEKTRATLMEKNSKLEQDLEVGSRQAQERVNKIDKGKEISAT